VAERGHARGIIDTTVVLDLGRVAPDQDRLQRVEATFDPIAFDVAAAPAYGRIYAEVISAGRRARGRAVDLFIAATALAAELPVYTGNPRTSTAWAASSKSAPWCCPTPEAPVTRSDHRDVGPWRPRPGRMSGAMGSQC